MINLKPIITTWANAIKAAESDRQKWHETAEICRQFYSGSVGFMWESRFRNKYLRNMPETKFEITIAKAFELVSIVGPTLMWDYPGRVITNYDRLEIPEAFWDDEEMMATWTQEYQKDLAVSKTRNMLMQHYLNYSQREQPGGGLKVDCQMAIIDSLVTGRGVMRVDPYEPPGGTGTLTGCFYVHPDDLFIDPDCTRANLSNAKWIAIRHETHHSELERQFGWPSGSLKSKSTKSTKTSAASQDFGATWSPKNAASDIVVWYEVFSKFGCGQRFKDCKTEWGNALEQVGDYAYLCFIKDSNELLNVRNAFLETADMEAVKAAFDWPTRYYDDSRWPVALLDYWLNTKSAWPMAPLAMGLGELIFLNVFISSLADRIFQDGLTKAAIRQELADDAVSKLLSYKHEVVSLNPSIAGNINELVSFLQRPQTNFDAFRMLEYVSMLFDKRVGLMELMYGLNPGGKVSRTAADATIKGEAVSTRPEYMAKQVENWHTEMANLERIAAAEHVSGKSLVPLLGRMGSALWDQLITNEDPIVYMREMRCRVEANSIRKPNKAKDNQNMQQLAGFTLPVLQWYAGSTGNTEPLNAFFKTMGDAIEQDISSWLLPPIQPPVPNPEEEQMKELEMQKRVAEVQGKDLKNKKMIHEALMQGQGVPIEEAMASTEVEPIFPGAV